ncbi:MAG: lipid-A-disaccharide synthase [Candidatus Omnitrophica bacterium]|nr:lipid-A-disaccharide synthase [Candidatus Omnitrophota bacterium]
MKKIAIIAGDKSGDLYGGLLSRYLKEKYPGVEIFSFGGENLAQHSQQKINLLSHSVTGIFEVLSGLKKILKIFKTTVEEIEKIKPDLIIPIDFPDFNLRLLKKLNHKYPVFYYISPQVWAWRKKRIKLIKKYVDKMIVIFKFEQDFYKNEGIDVLYFGHPLLEIIEKKDVKCETLISLMPGSRKNEIKKHLPPMQGAKKIIAEKLNYKFQIIRPANIPESFYEKFSVDIPVVEYCTEELQRSEFIITASGTATIKIAILRIPYLIVCKLNLLTWKIVKKLVNIKFAGMVNILSNRKIIEELLQNDVTAENIAKYTLSVLEDRQAYQKIESDLSGVAALLGPGGGSKKFADFIGNYLDL